MTSNPHQHRRQIVEEYVRYRLRLECDGIRGALGEIAKSTKIAASDLSNLREGRRKIGDSYALTLAEYWGLKYSQLVDLAVQHQQRINSDSLQERITATRPELAATLELCRRRGYSEEFLQWYSAEAMKLSGERPRELWLADVNVKLFDWKREHRSGELQPTGSEPVATGSRSAEPAVTGPVKRASTDRQDETNEASEERLIDKSKRKAKTRRTS